MDKDKLMITILSFIVIGILGFGTLYYFSNIKPLQNETTTTTTTTQAANEDDNNEDATTADDNILAVEGIMNGRNNLFEYLSFTWQTDDDGNVTLMGEVLNISSVKVLANYNLKFYDQDKNVIGGLTAMAYSEMISGGDLWEEQAISVNEMSNVTINLNNDLLTDDKTLADVIYLSFEDIDVT